MSQFLLYFQGGQWKTMLTCNLEQRPAEAEWALALGIPSDISDTISSTLAKLRGLSTVTQ